MSAESRTPIYRREGDDTLIAIRLREARSHPRLRLVAHLPAQEAAKEEARTLTDSMHTYFAYRERELRADIARGLRVGFVSLGWVAMWRPMEALLYDWWPLVSRRRVPRRQAFIPVEVWVTA